MFYVVTGPVGIGKSTVVSQVVQRLRRRGLCVGGVLTKGDSRGNKWVLDLSGLRRGLLAGFDKRGDFTLGRYGMRQTGIDLANQAFETGISSDLLVVDELGVLELRNEGFVTALEAIDERGDAPVLAVIREKLLPPYQQRLGQFDEIFSVTLENRNMLYKDILQALLI